MVVIVRRFAVSIEDLAQLNRLPAVDELRPACCPGCDQPARPAGKTLQIVGHGTYRRQALGLLGEASELVVWIRRFLCRGCRRTISVLPDALYPGRWYSAAAIVLSLVLSLLQDEPAAKVRGRLCRTGETRGWKTLERWQRQLLDPLWSWLARQVGGKQRQGRDSRCSKLRRLLALQGARAQSPPNEIDEVARRLGRDTAHAGSIGWEIRRGPPGAVTS